eukprot:CAMPEP_0184748588 /NCGR_PEP_ID=MMETSP0315-20130426/20913_1 /TAXON_ID=101924 /ORGANISM="Rhodosorus marinus, Strain UTEX LB 2760" /LENGTH=174 /DNA_ID=CAMNT_0027224137 /DNA_START=94 /DNA_END=619 /DNA_ORIENTATION=-
MGQDDGETVDLYATEFETTLEELRRYDEHYLSDFMQVQLFVNGLNAHTHTCVSSLRPRTLEDAVRLVVTIPTAENNESEGEDKQANRRVRQSSDHPPSPPIHEEPTPMHVGATQDGVVRVIEENEPTELRGQRVKRGSRAMRLGSRTQAREDPVNPSRQGHAGARLAPQATHVM